MKNQLNQISYGAQVVKSLYHVKRNSEEVGLDTKAKSFISFFGLKPINLANLLKPSLQLKKLCQIVYLKLREVGLKPRYSSLV